MENRSTPHKKTREWTPDDQSAWDKNRQRIVAEEAANRALDCVCSRLNDNQGMVLTQEIVDTVKLTARMILEAADDPDGHVLFDHLGQRDLWHHAREAREANRKILAESNE